MHLCKLSARQVTLRLSAREHANATRHVCTQNTAELISISYYSVNDTA